MPVLVANQQYQSTAVPAILLGRSSRCNNWQTQRQETVLT